MKIDEIEMIELGRWHSAHLAFNDTGPLKVGAKTRVFTVFSRSNRSLLGYIKWWHRWRKYVFMPLNSVFDDLCLRQIAQFCAEATATHKSRLPNKNRVKNMMLARRARRIEQLALTKQERHGTIDLVAEVPGPKNPVVEGSQLEPTPLEVELGTFTV